MLQILAIIFLVNSFFIFIISTGVVFIYEDGYQEEIILSFEQIALFSIPIIGTIKLIDYFFIKLPPFYEGTLYKNRKGFFAPIPNSLLSFCYYLVR